MCIFHQFCSIFDVFIRIDNSVLSFSTCYIHINYIHIYISVKVVTKSLKLMYSSVIKLN